MSEVILVVQIDYVVLAGSDDQAVFEEVGSFREVLLVVEADEVEFGG